MVNVTVARRKVLSYGGDNQYTMTNTTYGGTIVVATLQTEICGARVSPRLEHGHEKFLRRHDDILEGHPLQSIHHDK